jgi:hypothetical protein
VITVVPGLPIGRLACERENINAAERVGYYSGIMGVSATEQTLQSIKFCFDELEV